MDGEGPIQPRPPKRYLTAFVLAGVSIGGPQAATDTPTTPLAWTLLIGGSLIGGMAATEALDLGLRRLAAAAKVSGRNPLPDWMRRRPSVRAIVLPVLACALALVIGFLTPGAIRAIRFQLYGCDPPTAIRVLTTQESVAAATELATTYEQATAAKNRGCPAADLYVYAADPAAVRDALLSGWSGESLRELGPRPDLWLPDSSVEPGRLTAAARATGSPVPLVSVRSIGTTPLVLGLPPAQTGDRWSRRTWNELLGEAAKAKLAVVRPDPTRSTTGEIATASVYSSITGGSDRAVERRIGRALDRDAYPLDDAAGVLCRRRALSGAATATSAVILTEQQLVRYNEGLALGGTCPVSVAVRPEQRLVAAYPSDTSGVDHPAALLRWPDQAPKQNRGAAAFGRWLGTADGRRALLAIGLRPPAGPAASNPVTEPLTEQLGARPDAVFFRSSPRSAVVDKALDRYAAASRPARTLLLVDSSGSMNDRVAAGTKTRFTAAREAARTALGQVAGRDEFGLWAFPAGARPTRQLLPVTARTARTARAGAVDAALGPVRPSGGTPLYRAVASATAALGPPAADRVTMLVVLTDGEDTAGGPTPARLAAAAVAAGVRISVVALGEANCAGQAFQALSVPTGGLCVDADAQSLDTSLADLFDTAGGGRADGN